MKARVSTKIGALLLIVIVAVAGLPAAALAAEADALHEVRFSGVIGVVPAEAGQPWTVAGHVVAVNATTRVILTTGVKAVGMWADVFAVRQADDSLLARRIAVRPAEMRLRGPVQALPAGGAVPGEWTVAGQTITVNDATRISLRTGPIAVGVWVQVVAKEQPAGTLVALRINRVEESEHVEVFGAIQALEEAGWKVSAVPLAVNDDTLVVSGPEIGLLVHAVAFLEDDNSLLAKTLRVSWQEPSRPRQPVQFQGIVETLPPAGLVGVWTVAGQAVRVTDATRIVEIKGLVAVGARVMVIGWRDGATVIAAQVTVLASPVPGGRRFYLRGRIDALPSGSLIGVWTIAGVPVQVTAQTRILGRERARVGNIAEVGGVLRRDGVRIATWMRIREASGPGPGPGFLEDE